MSVNREKQQKKKTKTNNKHQLLSPTAYYLRYSHLSFLTANIWLTPSTFLYYIEHQFNRKQINSISLSTHPQDLAIVLQFERNIPVYLSKREFTTKKKRKKKEEAFCIAAPTKNSWKLLVFSFSFLSIKRVSYLNLALEYNNVGSKEEKNKSD